MEKKRVDKVFIYCDDFNSWFWKHRARYQHAGFRVLDVPYGHIPPHTALVGISCQSKIPQEFRKKFAHTLICHAGLRPGHSPVTHAARAGLSHMSMRIFEALDEIDAGPSWASTSFLVRRQTISELRNNQTNANISVIQKFMEIPVGAAPAPTAWNSDEPLPRLTVADSRLDPEATLESQLPILLSADPKRYPAYLHHSGRTYKLVLTAL